jgi:hypothetical protein
VPGFGPDAVETAERIKGAGRDAALRAFIDYSELRAPTFLGYSHTLRNEMATFLRHHNVFH